MRVVEGMKARCGQEGGVDVIKHEKKIWEKRVEMLYTSKEASVTVAIETITLYNSATNLQLKFRELCWVMYIPLIILRLCCSK